MNQTSAIAVDQLCHSYGTHLAVDHISFAIQRGTTFGLIGPNGAGKSTTIKMLVTLLPITSGTATIEGCNVAAEPNRVRQQIGYVPQLLSADGELTGYENLLMTSKLCGIPRAERAKRIGEVLEFMSLTAMQYDLVNSYSGGMIRRLEIAQALIHRPAVLILDEPTVGLDPAARKSLWKHIRELKNETTILMTTHDMDEADALCDIVGLMHLGKLVVMDTPSRLKAALGDGTTLDDVFIHHTGSSLKEIGDYHHVREVRRTISQL